VSELACQFDSEFASGLGFECLSACL
jgi:hypothetical protein